MKIFLGYASEHTETAREIYGFLKTINDDVWFDKESLVGGDDWDRERASAQQEADFVIHLISSEVFARAGVVNREIKQTLKLVEDQPIGARVQTSVTGSSQSSGFAHTGCAAGARGLVL